MTPLAPQSGRIKKGNTMKKIIELLKQDSTWKGIISLATALGLAVKPEQAAAITALGLSLVGLIQVFITEDAK